MENTIEQLEEICELLVELAALQQLRILWTPTTSEDQHQIQRFMLLESVVQKKKQKLAQLKGQNPELEMVLETISQQYS